MQAEALQDLGLQLLVHLDSYIWRHCAVIDCLSHRSQLPPLSRHLQRQQMLLSTSATMSPYGAGQRLCSLFTRQDACTPTADEQS